jgi:tetratricopeptide (TPR) repeat protein
LVSNKRTLLALLTAVLLAGGGLTLYLLRRPQLPAQGSQQYEQVTRAFYRGLAALDVGLLDNARRDFTRATQLVPEEPSAWANLGISLLRLGELDAAAEPVGRAAALAPRNADVALLAGRMEIARGELDRGLDQLKRAAQLDPGELRARYAVAEEIARGELTPASRREAQALYDELLTLAPSNLVILIERARLAAADDLPLARQMLDRLRPLASAWPADAVQQLDDASRAVADSQRDDVVRALTRLRNVLARVPAYRESLAAVRTPPELIAEPFGRFLALQNPSPTPDAPDPTTTFVQELAGDATGVSSVTVTAMDVNAAPVVVPRAAVAIDWNRDFRIDLAEADASGLRILEQDAAGQFRDVTTRVAAASPFTCGCAATWAADIEMDGDLDLIAGLVDGPTTILRNNGDGTWQPLQTFTSIMNARSFAWGDVDGDADPDAVFVDAARAVHVLLNRQATEFAAVQAPSTTAVATTIADTNADGLFEVVTLAASGDVTASTWRGGRWMSQQLTTWSGMESAEPGRFRLFVADLDNNGALDLVASAPRESRAWLTDGRFRLSPLASPIPAPVFGVADLNADGRVDLAGVVDGRPVRFRNTGQKAYHWKALRARAQETAGDQRINSFGVGGEIEVRSGLLVQKQLLTGLPAHFGLGNRQTIDVARIVWPNGVPQAEFDPGVDDAMVAEQRLKGSCPWVFTWDGERLVFVTDFLWRSPLGLRINAQDTAGTTQTEDWIRIRGEQLKPRGGFYDVRITAELWETHFFDHVSLVTVDHPADVEVFVDERFSPVRQQEKEIHAVGALQPVAGARDDHGRDVSGEVSAVDGRYLASFSRGDYQGIAQDHFVEFELPDGSVGLKPDTTAATAGRTVLIAQGWVYPTDSSINVAIGQRRTAQARGLSLEAQDASGAWRTVDADLGFPAGKNKAMVIDLADARGARRLRLRTNLEVYWDALRVGTLATVPLTTRRLATANAELRYRGFSVTSSPRGEAPETPDYARLANTTPRWRDLEGYYTRFGDVNELLMAIDDRYVIMNAGDEMQLRFPAGDAVRDGWRRDFVLVGDGWEKDGDYNTGYSSTVTPLPTHARAEYLAETPRGNMAAGAAAVATLEADPVYRQHREDWATYHTRYVTPEPFLRGLR